MTVVDAKVASLMCAYTSLRGKACCSNDPLLDNILPQRMEGFKGYVVSDCGAIDDIYIGHKQKKDALAEASAAAVKAGTDLECGHQYIHLMDAVKQGLITEAEIDVSLKRLVMAARSKLGMFDPVEHVPYSKLTMDAVDSKDNRELAEKAARESMVLLKNENNTLPIDTKTVKTIAVIGPNANDVPTMLANYNGLRLPIPSTPLMGIMNKASRRLVKQSYYHEPGCEIAPGMPLMETNIASDYLFVDADKKQKGMKAEY